MAWLFCKNRTIGSPKNNLSSIIKPYGNMIKIIVFNKSTRRVVAVINNRMRYCKPS